MKLMKCSAPWEILGAGSKTHIKMSRICKFYLFYRLDCIVALFLCVFSCVCGVYLFFLCAYSI